MRKDWAKRSAADRAGLAEDIPPGTLADVNATYPPSAEIDLILRDVKANIIVDVLPNVLPGART